MKRRSTAGGKAGKSARHKTATLKRRRTLPKAVPGRRSPTTSQEREIARLTRERDEALEQQAATSDILSVIGRSRADVQPVFEAVLDNAVRICDAQAGGICRWDGATVASNFLHALAQDEYQPAMRKRPQLRIVK